MFKSQEDLFIESQADAYFDRNYSKEIKEVSKENDIVKLFELLELPRSGNFIDLGGAVGSVAAGITKNYPKLKGTVLEPSKKATEAGSKVFPWINFKCGSIAKKKDVPNENFDLAIISMVFSWIDRSLLSQTIANIDGLIKLDGYLIIRDFYTPFPRANRYHHENGIFTYKQDYTLPFKSLNIYTEIYKNSCPVSHSNYDQNDPYDIWTLTSVLKKDLLGRYQLNKIK